MSGRYEVSEYVTAEKQYEYDLNARQNQLEAVEWGGLVKYWWWKYRKKIQIIKLVQDHPSKQCCGDPEKFRLAWVRRSDDFASMRHRQQLHRQAGWLQQYVVAFLEQSSVRYAPQ